MPFFLKEWNTVTNVAVVLSCSLPLSSPTHPNVRFNDFCRSSDLVPSPIQPFCVSF